MACHLLAIRFSSSTISNFFMTIETTLKELIKQVSIAQSQIDHLVLEVKKFEKQKAEAREETEHSLLQLQKLQEEFEQLYLADQQKQIHFEELKQQVASNAAELEKEKKERATELEKEKKERAAELEKEKKERAAEEERLRAAEEARVMTLESELSELKLQLHHMEEELEHQFLSNQQKKDMLDTYASQEERFQNILHKILQAQTPAVVSKQQRHLKGSLKKVQPKRNNASMQPKYD